MPGIGQIHWLSPTLMVASLLSGIAFALAHHILYAELNGTKVDYEDYNFAGFHLSQQQVNIAAGTALSFFAKVCLIASITMAYTQLFWWTFAGARTPLRALDTLHAALGNAWMLTRPHIWWRYPALIFLALTAWLIPVSSIVTPSTLSLSLAPSTSSALMSVPQLDFESLRFLNPGNIASRSNQDDSWTMDYRGPHSLVERVARTVASSGTILSIASPGTNASWVSTFAGPYVTCDAMNHSISLVVQQNLRNLGVSQPQRNFLAWTASVPDGSSILEFATQDFRPYTGATLNAGTVGPMNYGNYVSQSSSPDPALNGLHIGIAPDQRGIPPDNTTALYVAAIPDWDDFDTATFLTCELVNTTYALRFNYTNEVQDISFDFPDLETAKKLDTISGFFFNNATGQCSEINQSNSSCVIDPVTLQKLSYQAIMDAFGRVLVGSVRTADVANGQSTPYYQTTSVLATPLIYTQQLNFLAARNNWPSASNGLFTDRGGEFGTLFDWTIEKPGLPLARALEQMFQNITISMLSSSSLHPNASSPFAPPPTNVSFYTIDQVYSYSVKTLWLLYGLAIALSLLAVCTGLGCIFASKAAFSDDFSTILRAAKCADLSIEVDDGRFDDPLPEDLAAAMVTFDRRTSTTSKRSAKLIDANPKKPAQSVHAEEEEEWWPLDRRWRPVFMRSWGSRICRGAIPSVRPT